MVATSLRALWDEPRAPDPPVRVRRDRLLVVVAVLGSVIEVLLREDRAGLLPAIAVSTVVALALLWRRTHPSLAVTAAFGTLLVFDLARLAGLDATGFATIALSLVLPYALLRWGSGREAVGGTALIVLWLVATSLADGMRLDEVVAGFAFFLSSAALGASVRFRVSARLRDLEGARLEQRHELARDLHDLLGHHLAGITIQAQAGQAVAATHPDGAVRALATIEEAAARALDDLRALVGVLRDDLRDRSPLPTAADIATLARTGTRPDVVVHLDVPLDDLAPAVDVALHRIAQEACTNALRHARNATRVDVEVAGDDEVVRLTVRDDGDAAPAAPPSDGFGLVGVRERAQLLGGTAHAGPAPGGGWVVEVTLPRRTTTAPTAALADRAVPS